MDIFSWIIHGTSDNVGVYSFVFIKILSTWFSSKRGAAAIGYQIEKWPVLITPHNGDRGHIFLLNFINKKIPGTKTKSEKLLIHES